MEELCTYTDDNKDCKCILHCEKDNWNSLEKNELIAKVNQFWERIQEPLQYLNTHEQKVDINNRNPQKEYTEFLDSNKPLVYKKIIFPSFQEESTDKIGTNFYTINSSANEETYEITIFQDKNLEFIDCDFLANIDFKKYTFSKSIQFLNCNFHHNEMDLSNKIFIKFLFLKDCKNIGKLDLYNSTIQSTASFKGSDFDAVDFGKVNFNNLVVFNDVIFHKDVDFKYVNFNSRVYFQDLTIKGKLNLETAIFKDEVNFLNIKIKDLTRETARIIKHSFEKIDNIIEANKFYALEMKAKSKELKFIKQPLNWTVFKLHKISSNYSQNYIFPILWIILISFINCNGFGLIKGSLFDSFFSIYYSEILNCMANSINPFSIMTGKETLTFGLLIYKSIIAYLIYQFIVSIRQNTRRK